MSEVLWGEVRVAPGVYVEDEDGHTTVQPDMANIVVKNVIVSSVEALTIGDTKEMLKARDYAMMRAVKDALFDAFLKSLEDA